MAIGPAISIAVIIPAFNAALTLPACLGALAREGVPGPGAHLFVVDDGSTDDTSRIAAAAGAHALRTERRGPAAARNLGVRHASAEYVIFLDADAAPEPGWLREMLLPFTDPSVVAVKGSYVNVQKGVIPRFVQLEFEEKYARLERAARIDFVDTGTAAYRRDTFLAAGGFDESFHIPSVEDIELSFRLAAQGAHFAFNRSARVRHAHVDRLTALLEKKARYGFFRVTVYRRFPNKLPGDSYTPPWLGIQVAVAGLFPVTALASISGLSVWALFANSGVFLATCWPLLRRAWRCDRALVPWIIPLCFLRALAQAAGLAAGLTTYVLGRSGFAKSFRRVRAAD